MERPRRFRTGRPFSLRMALCRWRRSYRADGVGLGALPVSVPWRQSARKRRTAWRRRSRCREVCADRGGGNRLGLMQQGVFAAVIQQWRVLDDAHALRLADDDDMVARRELLHDLQFGRRQGAFDQRHVEQAEVVIAAIVIVVLIFYIRAYFKGRGL